MLFNFEESEGEKKIPETLKSYFFERCDMTQEELEELLKMAEDLSLDVLKSRLTIIANFFSRFKNSYGNQKIHNEFAYAKKIIKSDSFFENQKTDLSIPGVEETEKYLQEIRERRKNNPGVDSETFHHKVEGIKELYDSVYKDVENKDPQSNKGHSKEKMSSVLKKLEDEEQIKKLEAEIIPIYKGIYSCELDYRLFKTAMMNMYLYHGEGAFRELLSRVKEKKVLSIQKLTELRQLILKENGKENVNGI